jgi:cytochrome c biogenesis protein CcmG/thiol:disulfide interchange protein DsbE
VLNFWATWCPPCIEELPSLSEFASTVKDAGIVVLAVSIDKNEKVYRQFLQQNRVAFETTRDPEANIAADYGTFKWPETYVINTDGKVVEKYISNRNWADPTLMASIKAML